MESDCNSPAIRIDTGDTGCWHTAQQLGVKSKNQSLLPLNPLVTTQCHRCPRSDPGFKLGHSLSDFINPSTIKAPCSHWELPVLFGLTSSDPPQTRPIVRPPLTKMGAQQFISAEHLLFLHNRLLFSKVPQQMSLHENQNSLKTAAVPTRFSPSAVQLME